MILIVGDIQRKKKGIHWTLGMRSWRAAAIRHFRDESLNGMLITLKMFAKDMDCRYADEIKTLF